MGGVVIVVLYLVLVLKSELWFVTLLVRTFILRNGESWMFHVTSCNTHTKTCFLKVFYVNTDSSDI